jgi:hypothetical protein
MLNLSVELIVFNKGNSFLIIFINYYSAKTKIARVNLLKKGLRLNSLFNSVYLFNILSFISRERDYKLALKKLGNRGAFKGKDIFKGRLAGIRVSCLLRVRVARKQLQSIIEYKAYIYNIIKVR